MNGNTPDEATEPTYEEYMDALDAEEIALNEEWRYRVARAQKYLDRKEEEAALRSDFAKACWIVGSFFGGLVFLGYSLVRLAAWR